MNSVQIRIDSAEESAKPKILESLARAAAVMAKEKQSNYWMTEDGQTELLRKIEARNVKPKSHIDMFDYTAGTKAMLSSTGPSSDGTDWIEVELTADTGACDTVMPRSMAQHIPIQPSPQSIKPMMYEIADGHEIPNLGERRWTEAATEARKINLQVADDHKALLSLSRCADMGFESRFGRRAGALIDEESGEVIPLQRKGNLYVLKCWLKAAPFGRPDAR